MAARATPRARRRVHAAYIRNASGTPIIARALLLVGGKLKDAQTVATPGVLVYLQVTSVKAKFAPLRLDRVQLPENAEPMLLLTAS